MNNLATTFLILTVLLVLLPTETYAFGAGEIPDFAYLNDKAFRHGDIENILSELAKTAGHAAGSAGLFSFAKSVLTGGGGSKFSSQDVKRVYFGNWLRDYSQAMDIAGLSKLTSDTLVLIVSVLGFLTFGFATEEYQVTAERLGVYLPVEHIDNPKGYAEVEGDARQFHPKLRPPVNPEELDIDPRTGMKNYMASEGRDWDTSTAHVRRTFRACIECGRRAQGSEGADLWEAYRLLGTGLHTMEDLLAHSNWCELALRKMGHDQVFCHVGDNVIINTPNGEAPPLITGTFGSADFLHSLMGEATDHLSQASVVDLSKNLANASQNQTDSSVIRSILEKLPIGGGSGADDRMSQADVMKEKSQAYQFNPDDVAPPEVQQQLWELLQWRDGIYREVVSMIEMVPGLEGLLDTLTNALNAYVYMVLAPYLTPILQQVTSVLSEGSKAVIDSDDQYEVFNNLDASDPSHSLLSKDHFSLILNEPAGKIAQVVVRYSVGLIVEAWYNDEINPDQVVDQILEAFHHPYFNTGRSRIQHDMFEEMEKWIGALGPDEAEKIIEALTKESVRAGKNKREGSEDDLVQSDQIYGQVHAQGGGYGSSGGGHNTSQGGYGSHGGQEYGSSESGGYGGYNQESRQSQGQGRHGSQREEYGSTEDRRTSETRYGEGDTYGRSDDTYSGRRHESGGGYGRTENNEYGESRRRPEDSEASAQESYGSRPEGYRQSYGSTQDEDGSYNRERLDRNDEGGESRPSYQPSYVSPEASGEYDNSSRGGYGGYGSRREESRRDENADSSRYSSGNRYGGGEEQSYGRGEYTAPSGFVRSEEPGYGEGEPGYGRRPGGNEYGGGDSEYGNREERSYNRSDDNDGERSRQRHGGEEGYPSRGYGGEEGGEEGYERRREYGGGDETFGAERLQISGDDEDRPRHHHYRRDDDE